MVNSGRVSNDRLGMKNNLPIFLNFNLKLHSLLPIEFEVKSNLRNVAEFNFELHSFAADRIRRTKYFMICLFVLFNFE